MNNIQRGRVTCYMVDIQPLRSFGEGQHTNVRDQLGIRPGGFGITMIRGIADELLYNEAQNEVIFIKYLTASAGVSGTAEVPS
jgi:hypothetical protein